VINTHTIRPGSLRKPWTWAHHGYRKIVGPIGINRGGTLGATPPKHFLHVVLSLFNIIKVRL